MSTTRISKLLLVLTIIIILLSSCGWHHLASGLNLSFSANQVESPKGTKENIASIPPGVIVLEVEDPTDRVEIEEKLEKIAKVGYTSPEPTPRSSSQEADNFIDRLVFLSHDGELVLPELRALNATSINATSMNITNGRMQSFNYSSAGFAYASTSTTSLTFAYRGWNSTQEARLKAMVERAYPIIVSVYSPPAFSITVTIVKRDDFPSGVAGYYSPSLNEIQIPTREGDNPGRTLIHEIIHAFHDDLVFHWDHLEEGFTVAATYIVMRMLDSSYSGHPDTLPCYDLLNHPSLVNNVFWPKSGYLGMTRQRYNMSGSAWYKVYVEDNTFFNCFNTAYYQQYLTNRHLPRDFNALVDLASSIQPTVEGEPFKEWFSRQHALSNKVTTGRKLYLHQYIYPDSPYTFYLNAYYYQTTLTGDEQPLSGTLTLRFRDVAGQEVFSSPSASEIKVTDGFSTSRTYLSLYHLPPQRITITATVRIENGNEINFTIIFPNGSAGQNKVSGSVMGREKGVLNYTFDGVTTFTTTVSHGIFMIPGYADYQKISLSYTSEDGLTFTRRVNGGKGFMVLNLIIPASSIINISPSSLFFSTYLNGPSPPAQSLLVKKVAGSPFTCKIEPSQPWVRIEPASFTLSDEVVVSISVSQAGLNAGTYNAILSFYEIQGSFANLLRSIPLTHEIKINQPPAFINLPATLQAPAGQPFFFEVKVNDLEGDPLTFSLAEAPEGMTIFDAGLIIWDAPTAGRFTINVSVSDGVNPIVTSTLTLIVSALPSFINLPVNITIPADQPFSFQVQATDPDGDTFTYSLSGAPSGRSIGSSSGLISWSSPRMGNYTITVSVSDEVNPPVTSTISLKVTTILSFIIDKTYYAINGVIQIMDVAPIIVEGRTLLPIRFVAEPLGAGVSWNGTAKKVTIMLETTTIELWINNPVAKVNGRDTYIDPANHRVVPILKDNRTLLPLRFVSENLGAEVIWDGILKTVTVRYPR